MDSETNENKVEENSDSRADAIAIVCLIAITMATVFYWLVNQ